MSNLIELLVTFEYSRDPPVFTTFWERDVPHSLGLVDTHSIEITDINDDVDDDTVSTELTVKVVFEPFADTVEKALEDAHRFWTDTDPTNEESNFGELEAVDVTIVRGRWRHSSKWIPFEQTTETYVIEASGEEITVPDDVIVIEDPDDAPYRKQYLEQQYPGRDSYDSFRYATDSGQPFAVWERYEDFHSSAWWSSVIPNPGSADRHYEKPAEDEYAAARRAIELAQKYDVPLLIWNH